jgi:lipoate synthase
VILKLQKDASSYLTELAALNAHHASVRLRAKYQSSLLVMQRIAENEPDSASGLAAKSRLEQVDY